MGLRTDAVEAFPAAGEGIAAQHVRDLPLGGRGVGERERDTRRAPFRSALRERDSRRSDTRRRGKHRSRRGHASRGSACLRSVTRARSSPVEVLAPAMHPTVSEAVMSKFRNIVDALKQPVEAVGDKLAKPFHALEKEAKLVQ